MRSKITVENVNETKIIYYLEFNEVKQTDLVLKL